MNLHCKSFRIKGISVCVICAKNKEGSVIILICVTILWVEKNEIISLKYVMTTNDLVKTAGSRWMQVASD